MLLQEIYNLYPDNQIVLVLSNNNDVLITGQCFNTDSKFYRRSKVRLGVDFSYIGYIANNTLVHTGDINNTPKTMPMLFRTYRGNNLNDYLLYVFTGDYVLLEHYKRAVSYKRAMVQTCKQLNLNSITKPAIDRVLDICPHIYKNHTYFISYRNGGLSNGLYYSPLYKNTTPYSFYGYYLGVLTGLTTAKKYKGRIDNIRIFHNDDYMSDGIYKFPLGYWKPKNNYTRDYIYKITQLKNELQSMGISITFMK